MSEEAVIRLDQVSKKYTLSHRAPGDDGLRHLLQAKLATPWRFLGRGRAPEEPPSEEEFWALRDISFELKRGEVLGIIGRNGAGKSTLLKILSRITEPSEGRIEIAGKVATLLEVGTGFHPELTGRENIFLNGAILGMSRAETLRKFDEIVAFAEVERFLDTPVKRYSSGMYVRLAFAVAAHLEPEILIVDEVLAVGDAEFQRKCLGKMKSVSDQEGRTVLFVSHNMMAVNRLCSRAILLSGGRVLADSETQQVTKQYQTLTLPRQSRVEWPDAPGAPGDAVCRLRRAAITDVRGEDLTTAAIHESFQVELDFEVLASGHVIVPNFHFYNEEGLCLFIAQDHDPQWARRPRPTGWYRCRLAIPANFLAEGYVSITVVLTTFSPFVVHASVPEAIGVVIEDIGAPNTSRGDYTGTLPGVVRPLLASTNEYEPIATR